MLRRVALAALILTAFRADAADPAVSRTDLGDVTGTVVRADAGSVTVKVPQVVQSGVTRKRVGGRSGRTISVPKYTIKQVEVAYTVAADAVVRSAAGTATLDDVRAGETVRLHVYRVTERAAGEKPVTRVEVRRIDVQGSATSR